MRDPHVQVLYFSADPESEGIEYTSQAPSVEWDAEQAHYLLKAGELTAWPKKHFASVEEAKAALLTELEAWEAHVDLMGRGNELRFHYKYAEVVDRDPPPPGIKTVHCGTAIAVITSNMKGHASIVRGNYPNPPSFARVDTDIVRDLIARYRQWQEGREPFASMAYAALTRIIIRAGGRREAAKRYNISQEVIRRISELVSTGKGNPLEVRKFSQDGTQPMPTADQNWLRKTVPAIITQVAIVEAGGYPEKLTM